MMMAMMMSASMRGSFGMCLSE